MFSRQRWSTMLPLAVALAATPTLGGCFGRFAALQAVYKFNKDVSGSIVVQEIVFLLFVIIPVYEVVAFVDAIILNPIELFTGSNPVALNDGESQVIPLDGGEATVTRTADGLRIERRIGDQVDVFVLRPGEHGLQLLDGAGATMAASERLDDGTFRVVDASGRVLYAPGHALLAELDDAWLRNGGDGIAAVAGRELADRECLALAR